MGLLVVRFHGKCSHNFIKNAGANYMYLITIQWQPVGTSGFIFPMITVTMPCQFLLNYKLDSCYHF